MSKRVSERGKERKREGGREGGRKERDPSTCSILTIIMTNAGMLRILS